MLYRLLGKSGALKNCYKDEAMQWVASGDWMDITKYKDKEHEDEHKPIFLHERAKPKEPEHKPNQRSNNRVHDSSDTEANGQCEVNGKNVLQGKDVPQGQDVVDEPVKRKRGRPRKK